MTTSTCIPVWKKSFRENDRIYLFVAPSILLYLLRTTQIISMLLCPSQHDVRNSCKASTSTSTYYKYLTFVMADGGAQYKVLCTVHKTSGTNTFALVLRWPSKTDACVVWDILLFTHHSWKIPSPLAYRWRTSCTCTRRDPKECDSVCSRCNLTSWHHVTQYENPNSERLISLSALQELVQVQYKYNYKYSYLVLSRSTVQ